MALDRVKVHEVEQAKLGALYPTILWFRYKKQADQYLKAHDYSTYIGVRSVRKQAYDLYLELAQEGEIF